MVNCWIGARWIGFLGSPYERDCYLRAPLIPKPPTQTTNLPLVDSSNGDILLNLDQLNHLPR